MSLALAAGSPLAGGLRSQTCSPGWLASLIKEDRFLASFPPSLSSFFFFFFFLGLLLGKVEPVFWGQGEKEEGRQGLRALQALCSRGLCGAGAYPLQAASWG